MASSLNSILQSSVQTAQQASSSLSEALSRSAASSSADGMSQVKSVVDGIADKIGRHRGTLFDDNALEAVTGDMYVNVGGRTVVIGADALKMDGIRDTYCSILLLRHTDALPRIIQAQQTTPDGRPLPFLDASPSFGLWLEDRAAMAQGDGRFVTDLTGDESEDVSIRFYHEALIDNKLVLDDDEEMETEAAGEDAGEGVEERQFLRWARDAGMESTADAFRSALKKTQRIAAAVTKLYETIGGYLTTGGTGEVMCVRVRSHLCATVEATLTQPNIHRALHHRFNTTWVGDVTETSPSHFQSAIDFARRQRLSAPSTVIDPPHAPRPLNRSLKFVVERCGMTLEPMLKLGASLMANPSSLASASQLMDVVRMVDSKKVASVRVLYRGGEHGWALSKLLECVGDAKGLAFIIRKDEYLFGCHVDGGLTPPADSTTVNTYECPVFFFSLEGHFDEGCTKIPIAANRHRVWVAGTDAFDTANMGKAKLVIGKALHQSYRLTNGYLRFAHTMANAGDGADESTDLRSCLQGIAHYDVPDGYEGAVSDTFDGDAVLGGSYHFQIDDVEVLHTEYEQ